MGGALEAKPRRNRGQYPSIPVSVPVNLVHALRGFVSCVHTFHEQINAGADAAEAENGKQGRVEEVLCRDDVENGRLVRPLEERASLMGGGNSGREAEQGGGGGVSRRRKLEDRVTAAGERRRQKDRAPPPPPSPQGGRQDLV